MHEEDQTYRLLQVSLNNYYDDILNYMYLRIGNRQDAEDLTQETFLKLVESISTFRQEASLKTFIFSIAKHTLANAYRTKKRKKRLIDRIKQHLPFKKTDNDDTDHQNTLFLLDTLEEDVRDLVILKYYFGFTYQEISDITDLSSSHVGVILLRAKETLQSLLTEEDHQNGSI